MMNAFKNIFGAAAVVAASALSAGAATLSVVGGSAMALPTNYNPTPAPVAPVQGDKVTAFTGSFAGNGLLLTAVGKTSVTFTYLAKESGATNGSFEFASGQSLGNTQVGAQITFDQLGTDFVDFAFRTTFGGGNEIRNGVGGPITPVLFMAFSDVFNGGRSVYALFGDGGKDGKIGEDFDDYVMRIDITAVPLPAGGILLLTALGGIAALRRRKAA